MEEWLKRPGKPKTPKRENAIGVNTTLTNHKKSVQPEMNPVRKLDILPKCAEVRKAMATCWMKWTTHEILVMRRVLTAICTFCK